jgi:hypothetical protein
MLKFLGLFYLSSVSLSGIYYPTSPIMMHAIIEIANHLNQFENDDKLREVVVPMKSKFIKYWVNIPLLYSYALILDPRAKLNGFTKAIQFMSGTLNRDYSTYYQHVKTKLTNLFSQYDSKFGGVRLQRPPQTNNGVGKNVCSWNRIFGSWSEAPSPSPTPSASALPHPQVFELTTYLDNDHVSQFDVNLNILSQWHDHKKKQSWLFLYPLCLESLLLVFVVEMLSLLKDWEQGDAWYQHMENEELEEKMVNLYPDGYGPDGPPSGAGANWEFEIIKRVVVVFFSL